MIVWYDVLLLDDESLLGMRHSERFKKLKQIVTCRQGEAQLVGRQVIDFNKQSAASDLRNLFAKSIRAREEGLVLKPDGPYFDLSPDQRRYSSFCIKLKKGY